MHQYRYADPGSIATYEPALSRSNPININVFKAIVNAKQAGSLPARFARSGQQILKSRDNYWTKPNTHTMNGATASPGSIFPTRIFFISNRLLIPSPNKMTPPVAVSSFIMEGETIEFNCAASRLIPP